MSVTQETFGNGVVTNRTFDAVTGWLSSIQSAPGGGTSLQNHSYLYDLVGNVTQRQENTLGLTESFYYDNLHRLDYSQLGGSTNLDVTYDDRGNVTARSDIGGGASWSYDLTRKHQVNSAGGLSYAYDDNGNMTTRRGYSIGWSSYNYPTSISTGSESVSLYYGPNRQYYKQILTNSSGTETTHYVGKILERVVLPGGTVDWRHYVHAGEQIVAVVSRKSTGVNAVNYLLEDNLGSASVIVSDGGANLARESFTAFGEGRNGSTWAGAVSSGVYPTIQGFSMRGFTRHSMLGQTGLVHMNGRVYDATLGRFLSGDPTVPYPDNTQSFNRYSYARNNPLTWWDPTGFTELSNVDVIGKRPRRGPRAGPGVFMQSNDDPQHAEYVHPCQELFNAGVRRDPRCEDDFGGEVEESQSQACFAPAQTDSQRQLAQSGNRAAFWQARLDAGDPFAYRALLTATNSGLLSKLANGWLLNGLRQRDELGGSASGLSNLFQEMDQIGVELMQTYSNQLDSSGGMTIGRWTDIHHAVFADHQLGPQAYGGTPFFGYGESFMASLPVLNIRRCQ